MSCRLDRRLLASSARFAALGLKGRSEDSDSDYSVGAEGVSLAGGVTMRQGITGCFSKVVGCLVLVLGLVPGRDTGQGFVVVAIVIRAVKGRPGLCFIVG